jgi:uncharacterized protein (TIGR02996 family)
MEEEAGFIAAIAAQPDDELLRLVFADWLEEHGQVERAELIRLSCQLDPHRDRFDDDAINSLRKRVEELRRPEEEREQQWRESLHEPMRWGVHVEWRRGFVDALELPVQWLLQYGEQFRERYPTLRKLVLFRLNGWGQRLAECPWLRGIREIEFPCWYSDEDAWPVAHSPHLADVERVVLWSGGGLFQGRLFAGGTAWPRLRELHLVSQEGPQEDWVHAVNEAAGRPLATVYDYECEQFPFAANFGWNNHGFFIGKLPNGTQLFAYGAEDNPSIDGWLFFPNGSTREPFHLEFPPPLVFLGDTAARGDLNTKWTREKEIRSARRAYLAEHIGFVSAFIRVEGFSLEACGLSGTYRFGFMVEESWGQRDDANVPPEEDEERSGGFGELVHRSVRSGEYIFDYGNDWWCDKTGHVTAT